MSKNMREAGFRHGRSGRPPDPHLRRAAERGDAEAKAYMEAHAEGRGRSWEPRPWHHTKDKREEAAEAARMESEYERRLGLDRRGR